jgi:hypothetical protein
VAKEYDRNGTLPETFHIAFHLRVSQPQALDFLHQLQAAKLCACIDGVWSMHDWEVHQYESDSSTARVRKHRETKRNVSVTVQSRAETEQRQSRAEQNIEQAAPVLTAEVSKPAKLPRKQQRPPTPADITAKFQAMPAYSGLNVAHEWDRMCSWCAANRKQPSERRFANWLLRADVPIPHGHGPPIDRHDAATRKRQEIVLRRLIEEGMVKQ